jgi:hypothetical protein
MGAFLLDLSTERQRLMGMVIIVLFVMMISVNIILLIFLGILGLKKKFGSKKVTDLKIMGDETNMRKRSPSKNNPGV